MHSTEIKIPLNIKNNDIDIDNDINNFIDLDKNRDTVQSLVELLNTILRKHFNTIQSKIYLQYRNDTSSQLKKDKNVFRNELRSSLAQSLESAFAENTMELATHSLLLDLKQIPEYPFVNISISHSENLGGWIWVSRSHIVGIDIEDRARFHAQIIETAKKFVSQQEWEAAPSPLALWTAKEAAFKTLFQLNRQLQSQLSFVDVVIKNWVVVDQVYFCQAVIPFELGIYELNGFVLETENHSISIFLEAA